MPSAPLPESCSTPGALYRGSLFAIDDWFCHGHDTPCGQEEWCADDRVVVTRQGVWELEVAGQRQRCDATAVTFWNRETTYRVRHPIGGRDTCTVFRLTPAGRNALAESPRRPRGSALFGVRSRTIDGPTHYLHRRALAAARTHGDPLAIEEAGAAFLQRASAGNVVPLTRGVQPIVDRAIDFMSAEFRRPITIAQIAHAAVASPFHLSRVFRRAVGSTLYQHVVRLRLREALERVASDDADSRLSEIALDLGFASHSHLTDAFRAEYGCSPSEVRRHMRSGGLSTAH